MDIEELLREKLQTNAGRPLPGPDFEEGVRRTLTTRGAPHGLGRRSRLAELFVGLAAVAAVVAIGLPWVLGPRGGTTGPEVSESPSVEPSGISSAAPSDAATPSPGESESPALPSLLPTATATSSTSAAPAPSGLARGRIFQFEFDYPAAWELHDNGGRLNGLTPANELLGTLGQASEVRRPSDQTDACMGLPNVSDGSCQVSWHLKASSVAMTFEWNGWDGNPKHYEPWSLRRAQFKSPPAGTKLVTVAGMRAIFAVNHSSRVPVSGTVLDGLTNIAGADEVLTWEMVDRIDPFDGYKFTAAVRGPNASKLEAQVMAVMASLHYSPAIERLPTDAASRKAALGDFYRSMDGSTWLDTSCFSRTPGVGTTQTVRSFSGAGNLSQALTVRCTPDIVALPEQVWQVTLTWAWNAGPDHPAGKAYMVFLDQPDFTGASIDTFGFETVPYQIPEPSYSPDP